MRRVHSWAAFVRHRCNANRTVVRRSLSSIILLPMTGLLRPRLLALLAALCLALPAGPLGAQGGPTRPATRSSSRADIESAAAELDQLAASTAYGERLRARARADAAVLRARLTDGDFKVGDRIMLVVEGQIVVNDTLSVLDGARLMVPGFRAVSLAGVLRSELETKLRSELTDVVRQATVTARPLIRLAVFGAVGQPGYVSVPAETTVDELLMVAGGPTATAEIEALRLVRSDTVLVGPAAIRAAVAQGRTVGALDLTDGDALFVPEKGLPWDRNSILQMVTFALSIFTILVFRRR